MEGGQGEGGSGEVVAGCSHSQDIGDVVGSLAVEVLQVIEFSRFALHALRPVVQRFVGGTHLNGDVQGQDRGFEVGEGVVAHVDVDLRYV